MWLACASWLAMAGVARAQPRIEVSADGACVTPRDLAARVEESLTRDAPSPDAPMVSVRLACGDPITAHVVVRARESEMSRDLSVALAERALLADAIALGAVLALDELARQPGVIVDEPVALASPVLAAPTLAPAPIARRSIELALRAGALFGIAPDPVAGIGLGGAYRWDDVFSIEVEGLGTIPGVSSVGGGRVETAMLALRAGVCADASAAPVRLGGCVGGWGGALSLRSDGFASGSSSDWAGWGVVEGRLRGTLDLDAFYLRLEAALLGVLVGPVLLVDAGRDALVADRVGPIGGWVGLALGVAIAP